MIQFLVLWVCQLKMDRELGRAPGCRCGGDKKDEKSIRSCTKGLTEFEYRI